MSREVGFLPVACFLISVIFTHTVLAAGSAQSKVEEWSQPLRLFVGQGSISEPIVVADLSGMVHVFWAYSETQEVEQIFYARWDGTLWSEAVDIVASTQARGPSAAVDPEGWVHLIWHGPGNQLMYSRAHVAGASSVRGWTKPIAIAEALFRSHIVSDPSGLLHLVYGGTQLPGVYHQMSMDGGSSWSRPMQIATASRTNVAADNVRMAIGADNSFHVVWTEYQLPDGWPVVGLFYSRSVDAGQAWSDPLEVAGEDSNEINIVTLAQDEVHLVWNGTVGVGGRYHRWSRDGGVIWSEINSIVPPGLGGSEGRPQLATDSAGTIHLLTSYGYEEARCPWYSYWTGSAWTELICLAPEETRPSNYVEEPAMTIGNGNRLHAVYWDGRQRLWYTTKQTTAPYVPSLPALVEPEAAVMATPGSTEMPPTSKATPSIPTRSGDLTAPNLPSNSMSPVILGSLAAALLVIAVVLVRALRVGRS
jgi:hypothetical protein